MLKLSSNQRGAALISVIIILPIFLLIAASYTRLSLNNIQVARSDQYFTHAQLVADAGVDFGMQQLNENTDWTGTGSAVEFDNFNNMRSTYEITVTEISDSKRILSSTARIYRPATDSEPISSVTLDVELRPVTAGDFSVVTGVGGLTMRNSAKILGGNVFVNGTISMEGSSQIGLSISPVNLNVANQVCPDPPDVTYPRVCNPGEKNNPITFGAGQNIIYGTVNANNQTNNAPSRMVNPGLVSSSNVIPQPLPQHDREAQKAAITTEQTGAAASCTQNNGSRTWPANLKINGNVEVRSGCQVTVNGNVWITGTLTIRTGGEITPSDALGISRADIMVDGNRIEMRNTSGISDNASGTGVQLINYYSTAACSPDCTSVTGADFASSRDFATIDIDNQAYGPSTAFYAKWTKIQINNSGQLGALIGQTISLEQSSTITFGTSINTETEFWVIDGYRRAFN